MNAAFHFLEAGPSTRTFVLARGRFVGARHAADGFIALILQRIVGDFVGLDVSPDVLTLPSSHGVEFDDVTPRLRVEHVKFEDADASSAIGLLFAQAGDPAVQL